MCIFTALLLNVESHNNGDVLESYYPNGASAKPFLNAADSIGTKIALLCGFRIGANPPREMWPKFRPVFFPSVSRPPPPSGPCLLVSRPPPCSTYSARRTFSRIIKGPQSGEGGPTCPPSPLEMSRGPLGEREANFRSGRSTAQHEVKFGEYTGGTPPYQRGGGMWRAHGAGWGAQRPPGGVRLEGSLDLGEQVL